MATEVYSDEIKYTTSINNHSSIQYRNISPQATNTVTTSVASMTGPTEFIFSPSVLNLSKSRLEFTLNLATLASLSTWQNANFLTTLGRVVVYDSGTSAVWADISNFEKFASLIVPASTPLDEMLSKSSGKGVLTPPLTEAAARLTPYEDIMKNGVIASNFDGSASDLRLYNPNFGRQQLLAAAVNTAAVFDISIPFSAFKATALSLDKMIYTPTNLVLQIYWASANSYAWKATNATSPVTGAVSLTAAPVISNLNVALACESNLGLISQIISSATGSGLEFQIPYPSVIRTNISASTAQSYSLQLTRAYGNKILYIATAPFSAGATPNLSNEHGITPTPADPALDFDPALSIVSYYNTFLNNVSIKYPTGFSTIQGDDFLLANKQYLKGSTIQSLLEYRLSEWVHIDSWFGEKPLCEVDYTMVDGLDVGSASSTWMLQSTTTNVGLIWINVIVGQKTLRITNMGSQVM